MGGCTNRGALVAEWKIMNAMADALATNGRLSTSPDVASTLVRVLRERGKQQGPLQVSDVVVPKELKQLV